MGKTITFAAQRLKAVLSLAIFLAIFSAILIPPPVATAQGSATERSVSVSGSCIRSVLPDRGSVNIVATVLRPDLRLASKEAMAEYEKLKKAVEKLNLKNAELSTSESSIHEEREWQKDRSVLKGFRARMGLKVATSEISRLGEVVNLAAKQGIKQIGELMMTLSPEKERSEREACLDEAVRNARAKAETMAKAAGAKAGRVVALTEQSISSPGPLPVMARSQMMEADMAMDKTPEVQAESQKLIVEVRATYGLE